MAIFAANVRDTSEGYWRVSGRISLKQFNAFVVRYKLQALEHFQKQFQKSSAEVSKKD